MAAVSSTASALRQREGRQRLPQWKLRFWTQHLPLLVPFFAVCWVAAMVFTGWYAVLDHIPAVHDAWHQWVSSKGTRNNSGGNICAVETYLRGRGYHAEYDGHNPDGYGGAVRVTLVGDPS